MAVTESNNNFDFCDNIYVAKTNYNNAECLNIFKNVIAKCSSADDLFKQKVLGATLSSVKFDDRFFPVYGLTVEATDTYYTSDTETQEITYSDYSTDKASVTTTTTHYQPFSFFAYTYNGIYDSCKPDVFVGRNDQRFYSVAHVDDLPYPIYNSETNYLSYKELRERARTRAPRFSPQKPLLSYGSTIKVNALDSDVYFVPVVVIYLEFEGNSYHCVVNRHNGNSHYTYPVSPEVDLESRFTRDKAKKLTKTSAIFQCVTIALPILAIIVCGDNCNIWFFLLSILLAIGVNIYLFLTYKPLFSKDLDYFRRRIADNGESQNVVLKRERAYFTLSLLFLIVMTVLFVLSVGIPT